MGILLAAHIVEKATRQPLRRFLKTEIFEPLQMTATILGKTENAVRLQTEHADPPGGTPETAHWDWNSPYWRDLGAPWGGAHSTAADIAKFLKAFQHPTGVPVKQETARRMTTNQNVGLDKPWGIGWATTPGGFGHSGSTGTNCWAHFAKDARFVILTSLPARVSQKTITDPVDKAIRAAL
jgi:CubicO group peptidase (beta-lactamase class C family)